MKLVNQVAREEPMEEPGIAHVKTRVSSYEGWLQNETPVNWPESAGSGGRTAEPEYALRQTMPGEVFVCKNFCLKALTLRTIVVAVDKADAIFAAGR